MCSASQPVLLRLETLPALISSGRESNGLGRVCTRTVPNAARACSSFALTEAQTTAAVVAVVAVLLLLLFLLLVACLFAREQKERKEMNRCLSPTETISDALS